MARKKAARPKDGRFTATLGQIRRGRPRVAIRGPRDTAETEIHFVLRRGDARAGVISLIWPTDFAFKNRSDSDVGVTILDAFSSFTPISSIEPTLAGNPLATGDAWALRGLYATTDAAFDRLFAGRAAEGSDTETRLFAARQHLEHGRFTPAQRAVAAIAHAERALGLGDVAILKQAAGYLEAEIAAVDAADPEAEAADVRQGRVMRLGYWLWQTQLAAGDTAEFETQLDRTARQAQELGETDARRLREACVTLFLRAYVHLIRGERDEAARLATLNADIFRHQTAQLPLRSGAFREAQAALDCVVLSLRMAERMAAGLKTFDNAVVMAAVQGTSLGSSPESSRMQAAFARFCRGVRKSRRVAARQAQAATPDPG